MQQSGWRGAMPGAVLAAIAVLALYGTRALSYGTAAHVGPGLLPGILAALLFILGLAVAVQGLWRGPSQGAE
jgi:hypothetical protein